MKTCSMDRDGDFDILNFRRRNLNKTSEVYQERRRTHMNIENFTVYQKTVPERKAVFQEFPSSLHPDIREFLKLEGIPSLYSHQAEMFEKARRERTW